MTAHSFGIRKRRNEGKWLLACMLMGTTALAMTPKAEAKELGLTASDFLVVAINGRGTLFAGNRNNLAYIGDLDGNFRQLPGLGGTSMTAMDINLGGNVVVGYGSNADGRNRAFRATGDVSAVTTTDLGTLVPTINTASSIGFGVSDDGSRVVGYSAWQGIMRGFVWIDGATGGVVGNEQMYALDGLSGGYNRSSARAISGDGRYAVGWSDGAGIIEIATRWDLSGIPGGGAATAESLGSITGMTGNSYARAVSGDGSVVVGSSVDADGRYRAFRWREGATDGVADNLQMRDLGDLGGQNANANAVSRDGRWVVGDSEDAQGDAQAFRWSEADGIESISGWLERQGISTTGYTLNYASDISDDGSVVVGEMYDDEGDWFGYLARGESEAHGAGLMNIAEYQRSLYSAAGIASMGEFLTWLPMNGAHHRPLMLSPDLAGDMCAWATGDFAYHGPSSTGLALAEAGACTDLAGGSVRIGGAVGTSGSWQQLALGGSARMQGQYVLSEIDWQPDGTPLLLSLTGMLGGYQAHIDRAYSNGAATTLSSGDTNAVGGVVRLRADWLDAATIGKTSISPYASLGLGGLHVSGYTESVGPFPAVFDAQTIGHADLRLGVTAVTELSSQTTLSTTLEVAHRTGDASRAAGTVQGLFDFSLGGGSTSQTWLRAGAELDHEITDSMSLSASVHLASNGRDPSVAASVGLKGAL
ncbi:probable extracellular repeat, HAF family [Devosia lucknowensis]|uniref:Probable extracellular repeat, HAF family n=1 Tax=Devosia lucknowensis TaxID=1096929 RepID=A0A1Y6F734_9HYPH|nr:autotransporter domain-containing protein [Devosia lucknowensis]SMQ70607.1 probable extracellular repeat, HAF family [Devosia lucknowensis]